MAMDWNTVLATLTGSLSGAGVVVLVDCAVKHHLNKIRNFREAISIQLALHQMLLVSLQMRKFCDDCMQSRIGFYKKLMRDANPNDLWARFRYIDLPEYMYTFAITNLDWNFTQFLSKNEGAPRDTVRSLITAKLGFESLITILDKRNRLLGEVHSIVYRISKSDGEGAVYTNDNLAHSIGEPTNSRLISLTNEYVDKIIKVIEDCYKGFDALSRYINHKYCHYSPLKLDIRPDLNEILQKFV